MKKRIICFGDSNTWGYNPVDGSRYDEDTRWPMKMQQILGDEYTVIEEGQNGRTIANADPWEWGTKCGMDYVLPMVETHKPFDLLIIMLGTNDLKIRFNLPIADIAGSLQNMIMKTKAYLQFPLGCEDTKIMVVAPPYFGEMTEDDYMANFFSVEKDRERSKQFAHWYKLVADQFECEFFDVGVLAEPSDIDHLHLTKEGHAIIAEEMAKKVKEVLK